MRLDCFNKWWLAAGLAAFLLHDAALAEDTRSPAERATYTVKSGDVLSVIAEKQGVPLALLRKVNGLSTDKIRPGQTLLLPTVHDGKPEYYEHEVRKGEVLSVIAARYRVSTKQLGEINRLGSASIIRLGQRLKIPVTTQNAHLTRPKPWTKYALTKFERGKVTLTTQSGRSWTGRVLDAKGAVLPEARHRIQSMLGAWQKEKKVQVALDPRLYQLIVKVSDEFGGRPIRVVSGYRESSYARHSKHRTGHALDFSIPGVPNSAIVDFLITLPKTGVGYYPNTTHVHMDVRATGRYWVDTSGPGQAPRYVHKSKTGKGAVREGS